MESHVFETVCMLGCTGVGKSALANELLNLREHEKFKSVGGGQACTTSLSSKSGFWFGQNSGKLVKMVDVPGLNDTSKRDQEFLDGMLKDLREFCPTVDLFVLVF